MNSTTTGRILRAIALVGGMAVVVKLAALAKDLVVSAMFGMGDEIDAFLLALVLPLLINNVIGAAFHTAFVPFYIRTLEREGAKRAQALFGTVALYSMVVLSSATAILAVFGPPLLPLLASGFTHEKLLLTRLLYFILLPTVICSGMSGLWGAVLNAREQFARPSVASMALPLTCVVALLLFRDWGIYAFAGGMSVGSLLEALLLGNGLYRQGISLMPRTDGDRATMRGIFGQFLPLVFVTILANATVFVEQIMAGGLPAGSLAALSYGYKIVALVKNFGDAVLSTAVFPHFSRMVALQDWEGIRRALRTISWAVLSAIVPLALFLFFFADFLIALLFKRGHFTTANCHVASGIMAMYVLHLPSYCLSTLFVRLIACLHASWILAVGNMINLVLTIVLNYFFLEMLGVRGIALANSVMYLTSCSFLVAATWMRLRSAKTKAVAASISEKPRGESYDGTVSLMGGEAKLKQCA